MFWRKNDKPSDRTLDMENKSHEKVADLPDDLRVGVEALNALNLDASQKNEFVLDMAIRYKLSDKQKAWVQELFQVGKKTDENLPIIDLPDWNMTREEYMELPYEDLEALFSLLSKQIIGPYGEEITGLTQREMAQWELVQSVFIERTQRGDTFKDLKKGAVVLSDDDVLQGREIILETIVAILEKSPITFFKDENIAGKVVPTIEKKVTTAIRRDFRDLPEDDVARPAGYTIEDLELQKEVIDEILGLD